MECSDRGRSRSGGSQEEREGERQKLGKVTLSFTVQLLYVPYVHIITVYFLGNNRLTESRVEYGVKWYLTGKRLGDYKVTHIVNSNYHTIKESVSKAKRQRGKQGLKPGVTCQKLVTETQVF